MKRIAIISVGIALPGEKGYTHTEYLARFLSKSMDVTVIVPKFQHWEKKYRDKRIIAKLSLPYKLVQIDTIAYKKNIDTSRLISYLQLGNKVVKYLEKESSFDLLYVAIPSNYLGAKVVEYGNKKHIPVIINTGDLWPEAMKMAFSLPPLTSILYAPIAHYARVAYRGASGYIGSSDEYRDHCLIYGADKAKPRITVYVGSELDVFFDGIKKYEQEIDKPEGEFWVTYAGNLGASYDISTLIEAGKKLSNSNYKNIKIKILGTGPQEDQLRNQAKGIEKTVSFEGYQPYKKMAAFLSKSDILINSFVKSAPQSIVTKVGDYLAAGKPMINTLSSPEFRNKVIEENFGINIEAENVDELYEAIIGLYKNPKQCSIMSKNAIKIAKEQFDRKEAYKKIESMIISMI